LNCNETLHATYLESVLLKRGHFAFRAISSTFRQDSKVKSVSFNFSVGRHTSRGSFYV